MYLYKQTLKNNYFMSDQTFITQDGLVKLKEELSHLKNTRRKEVANRIQQAKEFGDLSENAEYADAKDEQAFVEGRIIEVEKMINNATIIKEHHNGDGVEVGNSIKIKDEETGDMKEYEITGSQEADPVAGKISNESPLGKAFLGKKVDEVVEVKLPKGIVKYKIIKIF